MKRMVFLTVVVLVIGFSPSAPSAQAGSSAQAGYTVTFSQQGPNVVATGSGTLNLTGLTFDMPNVDFAAVKGSTARVVTGSPSQMSADYYTGFSGPTSFGPGGVVFATSGLGDQVGINGTREIIGVPTGYTSGSPLSSSSTWDNTTISGLGLTPGTYEWTWGSAANGTADDFKVVIPGTATPEPASLTLLGVTAAAVLGYHLRRRR
jgi:hypothetical protein